MNKFDVCSLSKRCKSSTLATAGNGLIHHKNKSLSNNNDNITIFQKQTSKHFSKRHFSTQERSVASIPTNINPIAASIDIAPISFRFGCYILGILTCFGSIYYLRENLLFGTLAGLIAKTTTAPLERLAVYKQASFNSNSSLPQIIANINRTEGIFGFWRGNGINVLRASVQKGSLFALNDFFKSILFKLDAKYNILKKTSNSNGKKKQHHTGISFVSGVLAGLSSTIWTYPLEIVKTANQTTIHSKRWPMTTIWYYLVCRKGYIRGPWTAVLPTLIGTSAYYGLKFMAFDLFVLFMTKWNEAQLDGLNGNESGYQSSDIWYENEMNNNNNNTNNSDSNVFETSAMDLNEIESEMAQMKKLEKNNNINNKTGWIISDATMHALGGAMAGICGNCVTFPNNCVRKRMQTAHVCHAMGIKENNVEGTMNWRQTAKHMYDTEGGLKRFYNGFGVNLARNVPNTALQFVVYKQLQTYWNKSNFFGQK